MIQSERILDVKKSYETDIYGNKCLFYTFSTDGVPGNNVYHCSVHSFHNDKRPEIGKYVSKVPNADLLRKWKITDDRIK